MESSIEEVEAMPDSSSPTLPLIIQLLAKTHDFVTYFHASSRKFLCAPCSSFPENCEPGNLYILNAGSDGTVAISELPERTKCAYTHRQEFSFYGSDYEKIVLRSLLLESRTKDFNETNCCFVKQLSPLIIDIPTQKRFFKTITFRVESGELFTVTVKDAARHKNSMRLHCAQHPNSPLPDGLAWKSRVEIYSLKEPRVPPVTQVLERFYSGDMPFWRSHRQLLGRIYGCTGTIDYAPGDPEETTWTLTDMKTDTDIEVNVEASECLWRYCEDETCVGYAIEDRQCDRRTVPFLLTNMADAYVEEAPERRDIQLLLAPYNTAVMKLVESFSTPFHEGHTVVHLQSFEREIEAAPKDRSPLSIFTATSSHYVGAFNIVRDEHQRMTKKEKKMNMRAVRDAYAVAWRAFDRDANYSIILATIDMILAKMLKIQDDSEDPFQNLRELLKTRVRRVILADAQAVPETALNALILCFPQAQIVVSGDPHFPRPPMMFPNEFHSYSALEVMVRKRNVPVIKIRAQHKLVSRFSHQTKDFELVEADLPKSQLKLTAHGEVPREVQPVPAEFISERLKFALRQVGLQSPRSITVSGPLHRLIGTRDEINYEVILLKPPDLPVAVIVVLSSPEASVAFITFPASEITSETSDTRAQDLVELLERETTLTHEDDNLNKLLVAKYFIDIDSRKLEGGARPLIPLLSPISHFPSAFRSNR